MGDMFKNEVPQNHEHGLDGVQVGPFGPKLCQNGAPELRIIFQALLGFKTTLAGPCCKKRFIGFIF